MSMTEETIHVYGEDVESASLEDAVEVHVGSVDGDDIVAASIDGDNEIVSLMDGETVNVLSIEGDELHALSEDSGGVGTRDYNELINKPQIEGVTLEGNKLYEELNLQWITNIELEEICHL